jgi:antitoxin MazE
MKIAKWGNSLAVRLPASVTEALDLKEGDEVHINVAEKGRVFEVKRAPTLEEAIVAARKFRGRLPADWKFDRDEANERG